MKKSEQFELAMVAVLRDSNICYGEKLEIIKTLMDKQSLAEYVEKQEAEKAWNEEANLA